MKKSLDNFRYHGLITVAFFHLLEEDNSTFFKRFYIMIMILMVLTLFVMALENIANYKEKNLVYGLELSS